MPWSGTSSSSAQRPTGPRMRNCIVCLSFDPAARAWWEAVPERTALVAAGGPARAARPSGALRPGLDRDGGAAIARGEGPDEVRPRGVPNVGVRSRLSGREFKCTTSPVDCRGRSLAGRTGHLRNRSLRRSAERSAVDRNHKQVSCLPAIYQSITAYTEGTHRRTEEAIRAEDCVRRRSRALGRLPRSVLVGRDRTRRPSTGYWWSHTKTATCRPNGSGAGHGHPITTGPGGGPSRADSGGDVARSFGDAPSSQGYGAVSGRML